MRNKLLIAILIAASVSLFIVTIRTPNFAEGTGKAWDLMLSHADKVE